MLLWFAITFAIVLLAILLTMRLRKKEEWRIRWETSGIVVAVIASAATIAGAIYEKVSENRLRHAQAQHYVVTEIDHLLEIRMQLLEAATLIERDASENAWWGAFVDKDLRQRLTGALPPLNSQPGREKGLQAALSYSSMVPANSTIIIAERCRQDPALYRSAGVYVHEVLRCLGDAYKRAVQDQNTLLRVLDEKLNPLSDKSEDEICESDRRIHLQAKEIYKAPPHIALCILPTDED